MSKRESQTTAKSDISKMICPFCSAPWSEENIKTYDLDCGDHCASGRFYPEMCTIEIKCHACNRLMYRKEGFELGY